MSPFERMRLSCEELLPLAGTRLARLLSYTQEWAAAGATRGVSKVAVRSLERRWGAVAEEIPATLRRAYDELLAALADIDEFRIMGTVNPRPRSTVPPDEDAFAVFDRMQAKFDALEAEQATDESE